MKMFNLNCPRCGKYFYGDIAMVQLKVPVHCPQCDAIVPYQEYGLTLGSGGSAALIRMKTALTEENMAQILYFPEKN